MKTIVRTGLITIPLAFLLAGGGMLWLLQVENAPGNFFQQVAAEGSAWINAHMLLLISTILLLPAALAIRSGIRGGLPGILGTAMVFVVAPTAILLAGQYAIDFIVPLMIEAGGEALTLHGKLSASPLISTLFYNLPNLVFLALMILSIALVWDGRLSRISAVLLTVNWVAVLLGNLVHPAFQRLAILLLAFSYLPFVVKEWRGAHQDS